MQSNLNKVDNAPLLFDVPAECLSTICGGTNTMLFDFKSLTGVIFADNGIFYMKGDGKWVQVTKT